MRLIALLKSQRTFQSAKISAFSLSLFLLVWIDHSANAGVALRLCYREIPGETVAHLTNHSAFPESPDWAEPITESLEKLTESGERFGTWTRGYVEAPQTGYYVFLLASDD